ncbi:MAG TPA: polymer-forming cytoskeletal protein [Candidatus Acidoferrales bacterium]|nr:polymer-forming cytoskeletal protein [Candidatus Acidoferrales bacterium]
MAWGWFDHKGQDSGDWTGFLEPGVKLEGRLESSGTFRIDSVMKGTLLSHETLILGEHAVVEGEIVGNYVVILGRFDGTIHAAGRVEIRAAAIVTGQIHAPCLVIEPGAVFDGRCHMLEGAESIRPVAIPIRSVASRA